MLTSIPSSLISSTRRFFEVEAAAVALTGQNAKRRWAAKRLPYRGLVELVVANKDGFNPQTRVLTLKEAAR